MNKKIFDFKFATIAIGVWLGAILFFQIKSSNFASIFLVTTTSVAIVLLSVNKKRFLMGLLIGLLITLVRFEMLHKVDNQIASLNYQKLDFVVSSEPQISADPFAGSLSFDENIVLLADISSEDGSIPISLTVNDSNSRIANALPSSKWQCTMKLKEAELNRRYLAYAECVDDPVSISAASNLQDIAGTFRKSLSSLTYEANASDAAALLPGLVLGDNSAQSDSLVNNLRISGLGHLTAVSGANVAILLLFVQFLLQRTYLSDNWRFAILLVVLIAFVIVARPSASVVRAAMMASITLVYWVKGMQKLSEGILFLAVIALIVIDPWLALSWGLALSAAATFGLIVLPRYWGVDEKSNLALKLGSTALAASIATMPILLAMGSQVTFATLPANILAELLIGPATVLGLLAPLLNLIPLFGFLAQPLANIAVGVAALIVSIANLFAHSIFAISIVSFKGMFLIGVLIIGFKFRNYKLLLVGLLLSSLIALFVTDRLANKWQIKDWEVAICDVGQGDATLVRTDEHSAMLIDAGPDGDALMKCIEQYEIDSIDLFVASHFHADHVAGILALQGDLKPKRVITASMNAPDSGLALVEKTIAPTVRENGFVGMSGEYASARFRVSWQVLAPQNPVVETSDDNGSEINNNSVVIYLATNSHRLLLTGDIEIDGQNNLMNAISHLDIDLVKVPHHGSAYQSPGFAIWASARIAWISVGAENSYGHPNANTILLYQSAGSKILTTLDCGFISIGASAYSTSRGCV